MTLREYNTVQPGALLFAISPKFGPRYYVVTGFARHPSSTGSGWLRVFNIHKNESYLILSDGWVARNAKIVACGPR
jgi:hypothetical protein